MDGSDVTTAGVAPMEKAMSWVAPRIDLAVADKARWGRPEERDKRLPRIGSPRGPGMGFEPHRVRPLDQAAPPAVRIHVRNAATKTAARREKRTNPSKSFSTPRRAGTVTIHQLVSALDPMHAVSIAEVGEGRSVERECARTPEFRERGGRGADGWKNTELGGAIYSKNSSARHL